MRLYYDLHTHSCLSPCGDEDMTPNNIVNMAMLDELDIIALSDHNTAANTPAFMKIAEAVGIIAFAGMELETAEEIHVLCLFYDAESALRFEREVVAPALPPVKNRVDIFGEQLILDENDTVVGRDERYLINATSISIDDVRALADTYGGIAIPAHVDKGTKSLSSVFGYIDPTLGFSLFELSKNVPENFVQSNPISLENCFFLYDSDAHYLGDIAEKERNYIEIDSADKQSVWDFLKKMAKIF